MKEKHTNNSPNAANNRKRQFSNLSTDDHVIRVKASAAPFVVIKTQKIEPNPITKKRPNKTNKNKKWIWTPKKSRTAMAGGRCDGRDGEPENGPMGRRGRRCPWRPGSAPVPLENATGGVERVVGQCCGDCVTNSIALVNTGAWWCEQVTW